ncbi:unnamed protein product [Peniophora sp. CBMAI 1063]|nr:unnamed protein product [Peniophora sp. CBMAI 1063]
MFSTQALGAPLRRTLVTARGWPTTRLRTLHATRIIRADTIKVPGMADSITEGTLKTWSKQVGETVNADEEVAMIETDKMNVSVNVPRAGKIVEILVGEEDTVRVGQDLFRIEYGEVASEPEKEQMESTKVDQPTPLPTQLSTAPGVTAVREDAGDKTNGPKQSSESTTKSEEETKHAALGRSNRNETRVKMSGVRLRIAERMKESHDTTAFLTTFQEIDMSNLMSMRDAYKDTILKEHNVDLGFMPAFARAVCLAVKAMPVANASIEGDEVVYRDYVDLSVTVASPKGLVTPTIRNAESMSFIEFEKALSAAGRKARHSQLTLEDLTGGSFTIANGGVSDSLFGQAMINMPQSAVLGLHAIKEKPTAVNGQIVVRPIMVVSLTYDHRLLDGREGTTFLVRVKEYIEDPRRMILA